MKKVLFLIHDLGPGGAEKVLVNLVNHMDQTKFDITLMSLFDVGVNRQFLSPHIRYLSCFSKMRPGNSQLMKLLTPRQLHRRLIKEQFDIEVSYLEGPSARIISGCPDQDTKLVTWVHCLFCEKNKSLGFRYFSEAARCYQKFHQTVCVSRTAQAAFHSIYPTIWPTVLYNTNDSQKIQSLALESTGNSLRAGEFRIIATGKLVPVKGFDRLMRVHARLRGEGYPVHTYILGTGAKQQELVQLAETLHITDSFTLLGYHTNPYKFLRNCDLFVCSSLSEGFSTAATEALIVGTPVCTVHVSGMKEMLGENNEYGIITQNNDEALYQGIKRLLDDPALLAHYRKKAAQRGQDFSTEKTVRAVEEMLQGL